MNGPRPDIVAGPAEDAGEHDEIAAPRALRRGRQARRERHRDAAGCDQHAGGLASAQPLDAEQRRHHHGHERERRADHRAVRRGRVDECDVVEHLVDAEIHPAEQHHARASRAPSARAGAATSTTGSSTRNAPPKRSAPSVSGSMSATTKRVIAATVPPRVEDRQAPPARRCVRSCKRACAHGACGKTITSGDNSAQARAHWRNSAALAASDGKKHSMRISCNVTSCGVPSVAMVVNTRSRVVALAEMDVQHRRVCLERRDARERRHARIGQ